MGKIKNKFMEFNIRIIKKLQHLNDPFECLIVPIFYAYCDGQLTSNLELWAFFYANMFLYEDSCLCLSVPRANFGNT